MSNDQLSWEEILAAAAPDSGVDPESAELKSQKIADSASNASPVTDSPAGIVKGPAKATSTKRKSKSSEAGSTKAETRTSPSAEPQSYASKDWARLEFKKTVSEKISQDAGTRTETRTQNLTVTEESRLTRSSPETQTGIVRLNLKTTSSVARAARSEQTLSDLPNPLDDALMTSVSSEPQVISVSQLNRHIREILEGQFPLLWLKAEISNFKAHTSGHFYFSLKDSKAQISAVMFRGFNTGLRFRPEDGMEVLVRGKITVYEPRGNYQIFCESMEPVGAGALLKAFEQLKSKLQREGLFDEAKKRPLPSLPRHIAIVTSPTGAAIRDMLNVLGRRFKGARITIIPCKVQGDQAPGEIIRAIALANALSDVDVMIIGRGGGSIEDLWAFNDEGVARAIASARVPTISAVGHEIDFTIADFVADLRAPTPSAAAELVVKNASDLAAQVLGLERALKLTLQRKFVHERALLAAKTKRLIDPQRRMQDASLRCDELLFRLEAALKRNFEMRRKKIEFLKHKLGTPQTRIEFQVQKIRSLAARMRLGVAAVMARKYERLGKNMAVLDSLSPLKVLDRGFSMITVGEKIVTDAKDLRPGQVIHVRMCQGAIDAEVKAVFESSPMAKPTKE